VLCGVCCVLCVVCCVLCVVWCGAWVAHGVAWVAAGECECSALGVLINNCAVFMKREKSGTRRGDGIPACDVFLKFTHKINRNQFKN
jgi:hypothetical protein